MANANELYRQGEAAYQAGNYAEAFEFYRQASDVSPHAQAYYKEAEMLRTGDITLKGMDQTTLMDFIIKLYLAAAKLPNPSADAMFTLGLMLNGELEGMPTSKPDKAEAREWFEKAAANGHQGAKDELAKLRGDTSVPAPSARSGGSSISLIGTTWGTDPGFHNYQLMGNGILKYAGSNGTWIQNGNSVTLKLGLSTKTEISELQLVDSNTMKGTRRNEYQQSFQDFSGKSYKKGDVEYFDKEVVLKKKGNS